MYSLTMPSGSTFEIKDSSASDNFPSSNTLPTLLILIYLQDEEITLSHDFIFKFALYFIEVNCQKNLAKCRDLENRCKAGQSLAMKEVVYRMA